MKKRILILFLIVALAGVCLLPLLTGCTPREEILKVYNWDEYIDESVLEAFEEYYTAVTGKTVKVQYDTFVDNETMYQKVVGKQVDYDVVCPSDYMIEKMKTNGYLIELDKDLGNDVNGQPIEDYRKGAASFLSDGTTFKYDVGNVYSYPYMWGTMGILYNTEEVSYEDLESKGWGILWDSKYSGKIDMKDSVRDSYAIASLYTFKNPSSKYYDAEMTLDRAVNATDAADREKVKDMLIAQKPLLYSYESDQGKQTVADGIYTYMTLQWSGDAVYARDELAYDKDGNMVTSLDYYIPEEGTNLWCDGWCIPKYAKNTEAANLFINFMCRPDVSIKNMEFIGYTSAIATPEILEWIEENYSADEYDTVDLSYFFGEEYTTVPVDIVQYPSAAIIANSAVMRDYGDNQELMLDLWTSIKNS